MSAFVFIAGICAYAINIEISSTGPFIRALAHSMYMYHAYLLNYTETYFLVKELFRYEVTFCFMHKKVCHARFSLQYKISAAMASECHNYKKKWSGTSIQHNIQVGMCVHQRSKSACAPAQSDKSLSAPPGESLGR